MIPQCSREIGCHTPRGIRDNSSADVLGIVLKLIGDLPQCCTALGAVISRLGESSHFLQTRNLFPDNYLVGFAEIAARALLGYSQKFRNEYKKANESPLADETLLNLFS